MTSLNSCPLGTDRKPVLSFLVMALETSFIQRQTKDEETPNKLAIVLYSVFCNSYSFPRGDSFTHPCILTSNFVFNLGYNVSKCFFGNTEIPLHIGERSFYHFKPNSTLLHHPTTSIHMNIANEHCCNG